MKLEVIFSKTHQWEYEKGITDHKLDKGGKTNDGITLGHYNAYCMEVLGRKPTDEHFLSMTKAEILKFYARVWQRMGCNKIENPLLGGICFDFGFNSAFAKREIQEVLQGLGYKIQADNVFGPVTIAALNHAHRQYKYGLLDLIFAARISYVSSLVYREYDQIAFLKGWLNRIFDWRELAKDNYE
jgi:lysozyme family protein